MRSYGDPPTQDYCEGYNQTLVQLYLAVKSGEKISNEQIFELSVWIIKEEKKVLESWNGGIGEHADHWLLRTSFHNLCFWQWIAIGGEMSEFSLVGAAGELVREIGRSLSGEQLQPALPI